jgi:hypothetical protein
MFFERRLSSRLFFQLSDTLMSMGFLKTFWVVLLTSAVVALLFGRITSRSGGLHSTRSSRHIDSRSTSHETEVVRPTMTNDASFAPQNSTSLKAQPARRVVVETKPILEPAVKPTPEPEARYLRDSTSRLKAINSLLNFSDLLFQTPGGAVSWSINQQDLDQADYISADGATEFTKWHGGGENNSGLGRLLAEEAQLSNGDVIDRWYHPNGQVRVIERRYADGRSVSVYYYENGAVEATGSARGDREIFKKYDRDGREIQF